MPKRPPGPYMLFCKERRPKIVDANPGGGIVYYSFTLVYSLGVRRLDCGNLSLKSSSIQKVLRPPNVRVRTTNVNQRVRVIKKNIKHLL